MSTESRSTAPTSRTRSADERDDFVLTLWTNDAALAGRADAAGVDRVGCDLETLGKQERQRGLGTWISAHSEDDLERIGGALTTARLFARVNPVNPQSAAEVDRVLRRGAQVLMLPMAANAAEVERFVDIVGDRAQVVLLLEQRSAAEEMERIVAIEGLGEVHLGLNDLSLSLGLRNRFQLYATELAEDVSRIVRASGGRFGFGGIGRVDDESLPIPSDLVYAEYARLGGTSALISRVFCGPDPEAIDLTAEVARARERLADWRRRSREELAAAHDELVRRTAALDTW
jgi:hypothetical protein